MNKAIMLLVPPLLLGVSVASADEFSRMSDRAGKWEFGLLLNYVDSWDLSGANGTTINVDSDTGWGFTGAYNLNEHFNLGFTWTYNSQRYNATILSADTPPAAPINVNKNLDNQAFNFNFTYNFMPKTFTPYITGLVGWTYLDSNIQSSEVSNGCWWDPWYGYICTPYYSTYTTTPFTYGIGLGVRWEVGHDMVLDASIDRREMNVSGANDNTYFDVGKITLSWMIR